MSQVSAPATPPPTAPGPDSLLYVYHDPAVDGFNLGRREAALGDKEGGVVLARGIDTSRPTVTGDGSIGLFVDGHFDLCGFNIANPSSHGCLDLAGRFYSVAVSPDAKRFAFVLRDATNHLPEGKIILVDLAANKTTPYNLVPPTADGVAVDAMFWADIMTFTADGNTLIYDAFSVVRFSNGPAVGRWSIYALHLDSGQTTALVPPQDGIDAGNPAASRAGNRYLAYDSLQVDAGVSSIMVMDLLTGESSKVASSPSGFSSPSFLANESGLIYAGPDTDASDTGLSLFKQDLSSDRLHSQGDPTVWYEDANFGVVYQRGLLGASNALPTVSLQISADTIPAQGNVTLTATASDSDGTIARVEFYDDSTKLGQVDKAPYVFVWQKVPAGNHLLMARAVDNAGGTKDSSPRFLTASGGGGGSNAAPTVTLQISADTIPTQGSVTLTATASDSDGTEWSRP
jgi:hypothetical protein